MRKIVEVDTRPGFVLSVVFDDGVAGQVEMADRLYGPMFEPLKDPTVFAQAKVDSFGAVCWPNGADLAPDALYRKLSSERVRALG